MDLRTIACPACETSHQFYLSAGDERHLRQCPACDRWFVAAEAEESAAGSGFRTTDLGDPPECPVEGCDDTPPPEELPAHVIVVHDGSMSPEAE